MSVAESRTSRNYLDRAPGPGNGLVDVLDVILDKGLVIDAYVRVSLVGIELLTIDARIVIASVDTYLKFANAVNRLDLAAQEGGLPDLLEHGMKGLTKEGQQDREKEHEEEDTNSDS
jgi:gas vesicle structural protein